MRNKSTQWTGVNLSEVDSVSCEVREGDFLGPEDNDLLAGIETVLADKDVCNVGIKVFEGSNMNSFFEIEIFLGNVV